MTSAEADARNRCLPRVLLIIFLVTAATFAVRPMVSYRALDLGASVLDLGVISSSYALLALVVAIPLGRRVDRWGEPLFVISGAAVIAATSLALIWVGTVWALVLSQAALGLGHIMCVIGAQTLVANTGDARRQDARFGIFTVAVSLGQLAGPAGAGILAGDGVGISVSDTPSTSTSWAFAAACILTVLAFLIALTLLRQKPDKRDEPPQTDASKPPTLTSIAAFRRVIRVRSMPHTMLASLTVLASIDVLATYLPAYGQANGLSVQTVGFMLSVRAAASLVSRLAMLPLIVLLGRRVLLALSMLLPAVALVAFPIVDNLAVQYAAIVLAGLGLGLGQPITIAWVAGRAPQDIRGTAFAVRLSGNRLGQTVIPVGIGGFAAATGLTGVFLSLAVMLGLSAVVVLKASFGSGPEGGSSESGSTSPIQ